MPLAGQLTSRRGEEGARGFGYNNNNNKRCYSNEGTLKCFALFKCSLDLRCVASQTTRRSMNSSSKKCTDTNIKCVCLCKQFESSHHRRDSQIRTCKDNPITECKSRCRRRRRRKQSSNIIINTTNKTEAIKMLIAVNSQC